MSGPDEARIRPYLDATHSGAAPEPDDPAPGDEPRRQSASGPDPAPTHLRPFILTSGRVHGVDPTIGLETQVTAKRVPPPEAVPVATLAPELQAIVSLCAEPASVAEISARVPLHLGVTRILVGDLRATGHVEVHSLDTATPHDPDTILRVIRGLRAIA